MELTKHSFCSPRHCSTAWEQQGKPSTVVLCCSGAVKQCGEAQSLVNPAQCHDWCYCCPPPAQPQGQSSVVKHSPATPSLLWLVGEKAKRKPRPNQLPSKQHQFHPPPAHLTAKAANPWGWQPSLPLLLPRRPNPARAVSCVQQPKQNFGSWRRFCCYLSTNSTSTALLPLLFELFPSLPSHACCPPLPAPLSLSLSTTNRKASLVPAQQDPILLAPRCWF